MTTSHHVPAYELCREWALHPWLPRPSGVVSLLRGGIITWAQQRQPLPAAASLSACLPDPASSSAPPLLTVVAAMIARVCR